jgi:hypothetical protein
MSISAFLVAVAIASCTLVTSAQQGDSVHATLPQCPHTIVCGNDGHRWYYEVNGDKVRRADVRRLLRAEPACARSYGRHTFLAFVPWVLFGAGASMTMANFARNGQAFSDLAVAGDGLMSMGPMFTLDLRRTLTHAIDDFNVAQCARMSRERRAQTDGEIVQDTLRQAQ